MSKVKAKEYSGKFMVRGPRGLHAALKEMAKREGVSMNELCTTLLAFELGKRDGEATSGER